MTRRRVRLDWLLILAVVAAVAVALLATNLGTGGSGSTPPSPRPAATAFAQSYLSYLDGGLPATALPAASSAVRDRAGDVIPASARAGRLRLARLVLKAVSGAPAAQTVFVGRDRRHTISVQAALVYTSRRWQVVKLIAPDLATALKPLSSTAAAVPAARARARDLAAARQAASRFARAYLDYIAGLAHQVPGASAEIKRQIAAGQDPLSSVAPSHRRPRVMTVQLGPVTARTVDAVVRFAGPGGRPQTFAFQLSATASGWGARQLIPGSLGVRP